MIADHEASTRYQIHSSDESFYQERLMQDISSSICIQDTTLYLYCAHYSSQRNSYQISFKVIDCLIFVNYLLKREVIVMCFLGFLGNRQMD